MLHACFNCNLTLAMDWGRFKQLFAFQIIPFCDLVVVSRMQSLRNWPGFEHGTFGLVDGPAIDFAILLYSNIHGKDFFDE